MQLSSMLKDSIDGTLSSKRVVTLLAFILCAIAFIANLFFGMTMERFIFDSMAYIAMAGLGATVAEKFTQAERVKVEQRYETYKTQAYYNQPIQRGNKIPPSRDPLI